MFNFLISLVIASSLVIPLQGVVLGVESQQDDFPKRQITDSFEPILEAKSALVLDIKSGKILYQKNGFKRRPIASITKLMTALVWLETDVDWDSQITIIDDDKKNGGRVELLPGETLKARDVFNAALVGSVNSAALALARSTDFSYEEFIRRMNSKAKEIGMVDSRFVDPTGLNSDNQATAKDVSILLQKALEQEPIREALSKEHYRLRTIQGVRHNIKNTNKLLTSYLDIKGGKTGYIDEAGYCLVNLINCDTCGKGIIVVILGANSKEGRFQENKFLSQWVFDNWRWE